MPSLPSALSHLVTEVPYRGVRAPLPLSVSLQTGHTVFSAPHLAGSVPGCLGVDGSEPKEMHPKKLRILRMELIRPVRLSVHEVWSGHSASFRKANVSFYSILSPFKEQAAGPPPPPVQDRTTRQPSSPCLQHCPSHTGCAPSDGDTSLMDIRKERPSTRYELKGTGYYF